ncbi:MAG TPA: Clp protease N-terminal domain-containing protein [Anaerolineales bacterium]|nr:Clp protease N-terminal domain-containing protein [Anaerolineales bacterium]
MNKLVSLLPHLTVTDHTITIPGKQRFTFRFFRNRRGGNHGKSQRAYTAQQLAQDLNHQAIEPAHLLLALLRDEEGVVPAIVTKIAGSAERAADLEKVARLKYGTLRELETKLAEQEKRIKQIQADGALLKEEVDAEEIAGVVARSNAPSSASCKTRSPSPSFPASSTKGTSSARIVARMG